MVAAARTSGSDITKEMAETTPCGKLYASISPASASCPTGTNLPMPSDHASQQSRMSRDHSRPAMSAVPWPAAYTRVRLCGPCPPRSTFQRPSQRFRMSGPDEPGTRHMHARSRFPNVLYGFFCGTQLLFEWSRRRMFRGSDGRRMDGPTPYFSGARAASGLHSGLRSRVRS